MNLQEPEPGVYNERTALAWQRTALALVTGAAIVSRLSLNSLGVSRFWTWPWPSRSEDGCCGEPAPLPRPCKRAAASPVARGSCSDRACCGDFGDRCYRAGRTRCGDVTILGCRTDADACVRNLASEPMLRRSGCLTVATLAKATSRIPPVTCPTLPWSCLPCWRPAGRRLSVRQ